MLGNMQMKINIQKILATSLGAGYFPIAPGTIGAMMALPVYFLYHGRILSSLQYNLLLAVLILLSYFIGVWTANGLQKEWGADPKRIVIDETHGQWIAMLALPLNLWYLLLSFVLFRLFDIWKPLGIRKLDHIKSGHGVMLDDTLSGVYALVIIQILVLIQQ